MELKIRPTNDWLIIKPIEVQEKVGNLDLALDDKKNRPKLGEVIAAGPGRRFTQSIEGVTKLLVDPVEVKKGDKVLYLKHGVLDFIHKGQDLVMIQEGNVIGVEL